MATLSPPCLGSLPTELLESVLSHLQINQLLYICAASRWIHDSVNYLVQQRFRNFKNLDGHDLMFGCSPPSDRYTTPYHTCHHECTSSMENKDARTISSVYAHFTPLPFDTDNRCICRTIPFDTSAYFTQLFASAALAKHIGGATTIVGVVPETFFRIRKMWLRDTAMAGEAGVLWLDEGKNVGLRLGVREGQASTQRLELLVFQCEEGEEGRATSFEVVVEKVCVRMGYLVRKWEGAEGVGEVRILR